MSTTAALQCSHEKHRVRVGKYWEGEPQEETRQQFVNYQIERLQSSLVSSGSGFSELLSAFRQFGGMYDAGWRIRDFVKAVA